MTMRIGVYGDSFTGAPKESNHFAWYNLLAKKLNGRLVNFEQGKMDISYGMPASPTFYSYEKFLKYNEKHDLHIFIASDAVKYPKLIDVYGNKNPIPISGIFNIEEYLKDPAVPEEGIELLKQLYSWYIMTPIDFMTNMQELLLKDIEQRVPGKVLIMPADIKTAFTEERKSKSPIKFGLWDFTQVCYRSTGLFKYPGNLSVEKPDKIACHMTEEGNTVLADMIYNYLTTGKELELPEFIQHNHDYKHYWNV